MATTIAAWVCGNAFSAPLTHLQKLLDEFPDRQAQCLREVAESNNAPLFLRGAAKLFLGEPTEDSLASLTAVSGDQLSMMDATVMLRILLVEDYAESVPDNVRAILEANLIEFFQKREDVLLNELDVREPESRFVLRHTLRLLWAQYAKSREVVFSLAGEQDAAAAYQASLGQMREWLAQRLQYGLVDRGSAYRNRTLSCLLLLYDATEVDELRRQVEVCLDGAAADWAQESLDGVWGGARLRSLESISPLPGDRAGFIWFGSKQRDLSGVADPAALHLSASQYRPPAAVIRIGAEREERAAYEVKTRYFESPQGDHQEGRKYAYVDPDFILGSFVLRDEAVPWQSRPWELTLWDGDSAENRIFAFAGRQFFSGARPPYDAGYDQWNASVYQYKNVLFSTFHRSDYHQPGKQKLDRRYQKQPVRIWIDRSLQPVEFKDGWWFARLGGVYLAFRPIQGLSYWWRDIETESGEGASILALQDLDSPFLLEVEQAERFLSYERFQQQVVDAPYIVEHNSVTFVSRKGDVFLFPLDGGEFLVNGYEVDPWDDNDYQLYGGRFVTAEPGPHSFKAEWKPFGVLIDRSDPFLPVRILKPDPQGADWMKQEVSFPYRPR
ncbi:MAG: hypothetical protein P9L94_06990 [Candidatus Hinthialibacter antarcticus]|nr:hypothetical protein [Candidatus Hinthialibacter antarcticus]